MNPVVGLDGRGKFRPPPSPPNFNKFSRCLDLFVTENLKRKS